MSSCEIVNANMIKTLFWDVDMKDANISNSEMTMADFYKTELRSANMDGVMVYSFKHKMHFSLPEALRLKLEEVPKDSRRVSFMTC